MISLRNAIPFRLKERYLDFIHAFEEAVDKAMSMKADAVLIPGDLFTRATETHPAARAPVVDALQRLKRAGVPVYAVAGNHEIPGVGIYGPETELTVLEKSNLLTVLDGRSVYLEELDLELAGVSYQFENTAGREAAETISRVTPRTSAGRKVLLIHQTIPGLMGIPESEAGVPVSKLPEGWDIIIDGHLHTHMVLPLDGCTLLIPGSTERYYINEVEDKSISVVEWGEDPEPKITFVKLESVRPYVTATVDCSGMTTSQAHDAAREAILTEVTEECVLRLILAGKPDPTCHVDALEIEEFARGQGALHASVVDNLARERPKITEEMRGRAADPTSLFEEYLKGQGVEQEKATAMASRAKDVLDKLTVARVRPEDVGDAFAAEATAEGGGGA